LGQFGTEAIVLRSYPLANLDKIAVVYSREAGKIRGVAKGAQKPSSKFSGKLEICNWVELQLFEKETKELVSIDSAELVRSFCGRIGDYQQFLNLSFVAEVIAETTSEREKNESLFRLILLVLDQMQETVRLDLARVYFDIWLLKLSGLFPGMRTCFRCNKTLSQSEIIFLNRINPGFVCSQCSGPGETRFSEGELHLLRSVLTQRLDGIRLDQDSQIAIRNMAQVWDTFLESSFERKFDSLRLIRSEN
jgi:DNA repair protein RecO (recombination protein O)